MTSLVDKILEKEQYHSNENFFQLYKNYQDIKEKKLVFSFPKFRFSINVAFIIYNIMLMAGAFTNVSHWLTAIPSIAYFAAYIFHFFKLNGKNMGDSLFVDIQKGHINDFEKKWLFNSSNIYPLLKEINFHSFYPEEQDMITDMIATKEANIYAIKLLYDKILEAKKKEIREKLIPESSAEDITFFAKHH